MPSTTIKVSTETRDLLRAQAEAQHLSIGEYVATLARLRDRSNRWAELAAARARHPRTSEMEAEDRRWHEATAMDGLEEPDW